MNLSLLPMWGRIAALVLFAGGTPGLVAMNMRSDAQNGSCVVTGGEKLQLKSVASVICSEVEAAVAAGAPAVRYSADVVVLSQTRLAAKLVVNGRPLPVQNFAVMDGKLSDASIKRFATALANAVVAASKS